MAGQIKVLVVHGWLHSASRYVKLKEALERWENVQVTLYEFPGFGDTPARYGKGILKHYTKDMIHYLRENPFDYIIAHSMGGNVALKAVSSLRLDCRLILINPVYRGIPALGFLLPAAPFLLLGLELIKIHSPFCDFLIKLGALLTVNCWSQLDELVLKDARRADAWTAAALVFEMAFDRFRLKGATQPACNTLLFISQKDRVIPRRHMKWLYQDLKKRKMVVFKGIGHTPAVEDFEELVRQILRHIGRGTIKGRGGQEAGW